MMDYGNNRIEVFSNSGAFIQIIGSGGTGSEQLSRVYSIAVDITGNVYAADSGNYQIEEFSNSGVFLRTIGSDQLIFPLGVALDGNDNIFVADYGNSRVDEFNPNGEFVLSIGSSGQSFVPVGITIDDSGNIYVINSASALVEEFNNSGLVGTFGSVSGSGQLILPTSVAVDKSGNVYVADNFSNHIVEFDGGGGFVQNIGSVGSGNGQLEQPYGVAVDESGDLYISDSGNNRIVKFAPANASISGTLTFSDLVPSAVPQNVTFTFRSDDGSPDIVQSQAVPVSGAFTLPGLFSKSGVLHIKPDKFLAVNVPIDLSVGNITGISASLLGGDANNNNVVDIGDFGVLVNAYGDSYNTSDPNANPEDIAADFNGDGMIDIGDFGILVNDYNLSGDP